MSNFILSKIEELESAREVIYFEKRKLAKKRDQILNEIRISLTEYPLAFTQEILGMGDIKNISQFDYRLNELDKIDEQLTRLNQKSAHLVDAHTHLSMLDKKEYLP